MDKIISTLLILLALICSQTVSAAEKEYRPGGQAYSLVWDKFYNGDHEPELDDPLIDAGAEMTLIICEAIKNQDMRMRRYAIGALGYVGDIRALPTLESILKSKSEIYYFRGDALHAIYQIDKKLGKDYALQYGKEHEYLTMLQKSIEKDAAWLTEATNEN